MVDFPASHVWLPERNFFAFTMLTLDLRHISGNSKKKLGTRKEVPSLPSLCGLINNKSSAPGYLVLTSRCFRDQDRVPFMGMMKTGAHGSALAGPQIHERSMTCSRKIPWFLQLVPRRFRRSHHCWGASRCLPAVDVPWPFPSHVRRRWKHSFGAIHGAHEILDWMGMPPANFGASFIKNSDMDMGERWWK